MCKRKKIGNQNLFINWNDPGIETGMLFAKIKKNSKYFGQTFHGMKPTDLFYVTPTDDALGYLLNGGPGGRYRLTDVVLFAATRNGSLIKLKG